MSPLICRLSILSYPIMSRVCGLLREQGGPGIVGHTNTCMLLFVMLQNDN